MDEVELKIYLKEESKAFALFKSLEPDNRVLPTGLIMESELSGSTIIIRIKSNVKVETLLNTLDDLLICFSVAEKCIRSIET